VRTRIRPRTIVRALAVLAATGITAVSLSACVPTGGSTESAKGGGGSATSGTVNWWGWTPELATAKAYITEFNKQYPKIKVNYKQVTIANWEAALRPALASSSGPDVFGMQPGSYVSEFGSFAEDLTPVVEKKLGSDWKSKLAPIGVSGLTGKGKLTALSVGSGYAGNLWINQGLFDKYKVKVPTTLDEWVQACKTFKANGQGCFVQGASQEGFDQDTLQSIAGSVEPGFWSKASKGDARWDSASMVQTLTIWKKLFTDGIMQPGAVGYAQYPDANNAFLTGKYAMVQMGSWYNQYATKSGLEAALNAAGVSNPKQFPVKPVAFPDVAGKGNPPVYFGDADYGLAVASKSKVRAAAETFVTWLTTSKQGQQSVADLLNDIPALQGVKPDFAKAGLVDPSQAKTIGDYVAEVSKTSEPRFALVNTDVQAAILQAATSVATGSATPAAAAKTMQSAAEASGVTFK
jgi:raffinose/stachyose/melibiose transport system substrate-binding protein